MQFRFVEKKVQYYEPNDGRAPRHCWTVLAHLVLMLGVAVVAFPIYLTFVASTHTPQEIVQAPMPLVPGDRMLSRTTRRC